MPEVPRQEIGTTALGFRRIGQGIVTVSVADSRCVWIVRRPSWPGRLLTWRHELGAFRGAIGPERFCFPGSPMGNDVASSCRCAYASPTAGRGESRSGVGRAVNPI